jgi:hypothetical protein
MADAVRQFLNDFWPAPVFFEMIRIFPDALFWGVGVLALVTVSFSYSVLFASLVEGLGIYYLIKIFNNHIGIIDARTGSGTSEQTCKPGFQGATLQSVSVFGEPSLIPFPSPHTFMLAFIASYILSVIVAFKDELEILGPTYGETYKNRIYVSTMAFAAMMFVSMTYRLFNNCDSFTVLLVSFIAGVTAGALVLQQNLAILGLDAVNLLGIPILRKRTATGNELMVCSSSDS